VTLAGRDGRQFEAAVVVAADGVHSVIARRLGLNPGWPAAAIALDMMEDTPRSELRDLDPSTLWVAYGYEPRSTAEDAEDAEEKTVKRAPEGYAYIFPKRDHVNIGIGYLLSYFRGAVDQAPYDLQRALVDRLRSRGIVAGASARENFTPFLIPVGGPLGQPGRGRVLLAGDAGGFVNGFTAEGIYYAMVSGDLTARAITESKVSINGLADRYQRAVDYEIGTELHDSVMIRRYLFRNRHRIARAIDGANREPAVARLILDVATGRRSYRAVRRQILARSPLLAARLIWAHVS
jgi:flavin-dependent dehydrogenase